MAAMVQVPDATSVTVLPDTVQTPAVVELNATAKPDDAVAATAKGAAPNGLLVRAAKVMVWAALATLNDAVTWVAAFQLVSPT